MKSFKSYLTPEEQIKELSLTEKAWESAKQKVAENKELTEEEQKLIDNFLGIKPEPTYEPDDGPLTEEQVQQIQEQVQYQLVTGPQGEQGPQGIPGEKGERGDQGEQGIPGIQGERGERGENGLAGLKGLRGEKGDQGIQGERGEQGLQGEQGIQGVAGQNGKDGDKGDRGDQGIQGEKGIDGRDGVDGKNGTDGKDGTQGERGEKGQDGKNGRDGKDGAKGEKGDRGERGEKGDKGDKGDDGKTPDIKPLFEKFNKLSLDINKKVGRIAGDMGALASSGGSGSYWLNDLGDTDYSSIVNATNNQVLTFDSASGKWIAADAGGGAGVGTLQQVTTNGNTTTLGITTAAVQLNLTSGITVSQGQMAWNPQDLTVDVGMANGVTLQLGQEQYIKVKASATITDGQVVMFTGANGEHILAAPNNMSVSGYKPEYLIGVATQNISLNGFGYITVFGKVHDVNTLAFTEGDILYADPATVGGLTKIEPEAPNFNIMVAAVTKRAGGDGHIMVRPTFRSSFGQLNDVAIISVANNNLVKYNSANSRWENVTAASVIEPAFAQANSASANTISIEGVNLSQNLNIQLAWNTANAVYLAANTPSYVANSAASYANSAFITANAAFLQANTPDHVGNSASSYANSAFSKANSAFNYANTAITTSGGQTITGNLTANSATAFIAGPAANSGVALQMPHEGALRNMSTTASNMYFDTSNGGSADGGFIFRSSSSFTELLAVTTSGLRATSAYKAKQFNGALDAEVSSDNLKFRVSNSGGIFPQVGSTTGSNVDISFTLSGYVAGAGDVSSQNSGALVNSYTTIYNSHGLDTRGDMIVATVVDKNAGKIYRVTFIVSNNSSNTTGYSIVIERII